jgi:hypothetical protein
VNDSSAAAAGGALVQEDGQVGVVAPAHGAAVRELRLDLEAGHVATGRAKPANR